MAGQDLNLCASYPDPIWIGYGRAAVIALLLSFCDSFAQVRPQSEAPIKLGASDFAYNTRDQRLKSSPQGFTLPYTPLAVWSKQKLYDLDKTPSMTFEFDAMLTAEQQELIVAFSQNKIPFGQEGADALTVRVTPPDQNVWIRTGFYKGTLHNSLHIEDKVQVIFVQQWQHYKIHLTPQEIIFSVDGAEMGQASLNQASFPRKGFVGFIVVGNPEIAATTISYQSFSILGAPWLVEPVARNVRPQSNDERSSIELTRLSPSDFVYDPQDSRIEYSPQGFTLPYAHLAVWSKQELYDLDQTPSVTFEFDAMLTAEQQEAIVVFSQNKIPWGQPGADALTVRFSPEDQDVWFRAGFYESWLDASLSTTEEEKVILVETWQHYKIQLNMQNIIFFVDDREIGKANLDKASFPRKGFVGIIGIGNNPEIAETTISYQNFSFQRVRGLTDSGAPRLNEPIAAPVAPSVESEARGIKPSLPPLASSDANVSLASPGRYHALVIAVQDYLDDSINDLDYPIQDAQNMVAALTANYTFDASNITFLKNPTKDQVSNAFDLLIEQVAARDNLLIFYAGHGYWDERLKQGFWLLADAKKNFRANWLSNGTIRDYINGIHSKHTLLISDACFSGGIFKTRAAFSSGPSRALEELYKSPSRKAMTSGSMKEVPDKSVFVSFLIKKLQENAEPFLSVQTLFTNLREPVTNNSPNSQVPQFGVIRETGDEDGEFVFIRRK